MTAGTCRLCLQPRKLRRSHIWPEFFYTANYGPGHRFLSVSSHPAHRAPLPMQQGLRERLLCHACEQRLSKWEGYAARLLRRADEGLAKSSNGVELSDVDVDAFRLFGISLLWRADVATPFMFSDVKLGAYGERLRVMLLSGTPGRPHECGFALAKIRGLRVVGEPIDAPTPVPVRGLPGYVFMARGYRWVFVASNAAASLDDYMPFVGSAPALSIPWLDEDHEEFADAWRRLLLRERRSPS